MLQAHSTRETRDGAREVKYLVDASVAAQILEWARPRLAADPYAGGSSGDEYVTSTIYFDTADFAVYRRLGSYRRSKYRIRRYGSSDVVFMERKLRTSLLLSKRRTAVPIGDLAHFEDLIQDSAWPAYWFGQRVRARRLAPVCQVAYCRHARVGAGPYGPMRLTFDTDIAVQPCTHFGFDPPDGRRVLAASTIVEMKYCVELPAVLQELVATFKLVPATISKYRLSLEVLRDAGMRTGLDRRDLRATLAGLTTTSVSPLGRA